jgi:cytochrome c peroxidase
MTLASVSAALGQDSPPGYRPLGYAAPTPGTYELPPLGPAGDGAVIDSDGRRLRLSDLLGDRVVALSFIYTHCRESAGCPLAGFVLGRLQHELSADPHLVESVRLVSLSFDPDHDTPEVMRSYGARVHRPPVDWRFLTTASKSDLAPILEGYGQSVNRDGETITHILRVVLIDRARCIRNVYSASFLHAETLLSDIRTVLAAPAADCRVQRPSVQAASAARVAEEDAGAADSARAGGADAPAARAVPGALVGRSTPPLGLPPVPVPPDDPATPARVALGRKLFFDRRLSANQTISCAICHIPAQGFTSNEMATALGIEGKSGRRNVPSIYNVAYATALFHDGRESHLERQPWSPLLAPDEMGNASVAAVIATIEALDDYEGLFESAFQGRGPNQENIGRALAAYERTLVSADSPFDRWYFGNDPDALEPAARRGFDLFSGPAGCAVCHTVGANHALFTDGGFHNTGIGHARDERLRQMPKGLDVGGGVRLAPETIAAAAAPVVSDLGRMEVTGDPADRWKYKTPSLRNVALTAPYMHDGSLATFEAVVEHYASGGVAHELLDPAIRPLELGPADRRDLVALLVSLTGDNVAELTDEALAEPVGERR